MIKVKVPFNSVAGATDGAPAVSGPSGMKVPAGKSLSPGNGNVTLRWFWVAGMKDGASGGVCAATDAATTRTRTLFNECISKSINSNVIQTKILGLGSGTFYSWWKTSMMRMHNGDIEQHHIRDRDTKRIAKAWTANCPIGLFSQKHHSSW